MATIHLGPSLLKGSSHRPAHMRRNTLSGPEGPSCAYLVLLRVEVAAFHVPIVANGYSFCGPIPRLGWAGAHLLRTAVSRHPFLRSPDLPLLASQQRSPNPLPTAMIAALGGRGHDPLKGPVDRLAPSRGTTSSPPKR